MKAHPRSKGVFNRSAKRYVSVRKRGQLLERTSTSVTEQIKIAVDKLVDLDRSHSSRVGDLAFRSVRVGPSQLMP
jgi:hypothetical protein